MLEHLNLKQSKLFISLSILFTVFAIWRIILFFIPIDSIFPYEKVSFLWGAVYQLIAIFGAVVGIKGAKSWGGWKSVLGRATLSFSFGLLFQSIGQTISSYYVFTTGDIPYPSLGDIGFFGSIPLYIYAVIMLAKVLGVKLSVKTISQKFQAILIPLLILLFSYFAFIKGYQIDWSEPLRVVLDFLYPLGQAFYICIAVLTYLYARKSLGGIMRKPILFFIIALTAQYISDFTFLYQSYHMQYIAEGINDLMYMISYFIMSTSLILLDTTFKKIKIS